MLALPGPLYSGDVTLKVRGREIRVRSNPETEGTAGNIWDASVLLAEYIAGLDLREL
jgi:hypothetical protein